jgi:hypothetical protein
MRRSSLKRGSKWVVGVAALAIVSSGCGSGNDPEPKKPGSSRELVEHPLDAVGGEKKPQKPVTPKVQADLEKAKRADPRNR